MSLIRLALLLLACEGVFSNPSSDIHLCYLLFGPINDLGFTYRHNIGRMHVYRELTALFPHKTIISHYVEGTFGDFDKYAPGFIQRGCQFIFITSPPEGEDFISFVRQYRNVSFAMLHDGSLTEQEPNLVLFSWRPFLTWYKAGIAAASYRTSCVGFVASFTDNMRLRQSINAFIYGLQHALGNTEKLHVIDIQSWYDPFAERLAARILHKKLQCDVLAQYTDSFAVLDYARTNAIASIAMHNDASTHYGDSVLTSVVTVWDTIYLNFVLQSINGSLETITEVISDPVTELGPISPLAYFKLVQSLENITAPEEVCQLINGTQICYNFGDLDAPRLPDLHTGIIHHGVLDAEYCSAGEALDREIDPVTGKIVYTCTLCPDGTYLEADTLACVDCVPGRAECVSLTIPAFALVIAIALPVFAVLAVVMYFWHTHRTGILRHEVRQEIANFVFHEIRNPMHVVVNTLDVAPPSVQQWEYFPILEESSDIIQQILNRALDLLKIQGGKMQLECVRMNLHKTVCVAVEISQATKTDEKKRLDLVMGPNLPKYIKSDPLRVQQIIVNLATNALKFCRTEVKVTIQVKGDNILAIHVEDNGIGMSPEAQERLFQAFTQARPGIAREYGGTGLGLSITQKLVATMKGTLAVDSEEDVGSEFHAEIPFVPLSTQEQGSIPSQPTLDRVGFNSQQMDLSHRCILFADDVAINRVVGEDFLKSMNVQTYRLAEDGQILVDMVREAHNEKQTIHAMFVDLWMPNKDGWEAIAEIRQLEREGNHMKSYIIALSGSNSPVDVHRAMKVGANVFLSKPATKKEMGAALLDALIVEDSSSPDETTSPCRDNLFTDLGSHAP